MTDIHTIEAEVSHIRNGATGSLDKMFDFADKMCLRLFKHTGAIYPMFHAETATDTFIIRTMLEHKQAVADMLTDYFAEQNVQRFVFINEAWILECKTEHYSREQVDHIMRHGLTDHPDRIEVVMIHAQDINYVRTGRRNIIRPKKGKAKLGPLAIGNDSDFQHNRWAQLLNHLRTGRLQ